MPLPTDDPLPPIFDVHIEFDEWGGALHADVRSGLTATPKSIPPKWLYDKRGSELFDQITRLDEYYPTRTEREILRHFAAEISTSSGATTLVELGSGTTDKTRLLLDAFYGTGQLDRFVPFDVSEAILRESSEAIAQNYPGVQVHGVVGDFDRHLGKIPVGGRRVVAFLGSTIGNLEPAGRATFLAAIAASLQPGDAFLLGTDLVKDRGRLRAAYNDAAGVTAAFNKNLLTVLNREVHADFDLHGFEHYAEYDETNSWIDIRLRSTRAQKVTVADLDLVVDFAEGEDLRTEVSTKFTLGGLEDELSAAGLHLTEWWTDPRNDFAVSLSVA